MRQALTLLSKGAFQIVFSTHSPLMLSRDNAADTVIVGKSKQKGTYARQPLRHAVAKALDDAESQSRTLFELGNIAEIYFADRVALCEGKTDRRLLPLAYERLYGYPADLQRTCFVSLGSCSDIPKALAVLSAMGISACAVADLDFAFTHARRGATSMLPKDGADLATVKNLLAKLQPQHGFVLGGNGLPENQKNASGGWTAADVWALMANHEEGLGYAEAAQTALKANRVWIWKHGSIEHVTGHSDKGEEAILAQEASLGKMTPEEVRASLQEFVRFFEWSDEQI